MEFFNRPKLKHQENYPFGKNKFVLNTVSNKIGKAGREFKLLLTDIDSNNGLTEISCVFVDVLASPNPSVGNPNKYAKAPPQTIELWYISNTELISEKSVATILDSTA